MKYLLENGIDISVMNAQGQKAIDLVRDDVDIGSLLQSYDVIYSARTPSPPRHPLIERIYP